ncbi:hypothetical protein ACIQUZ_35265 [Streptomyces griseus]|uniref:hypothetical protein n=1 Tax=Streptomyces TaxID=1883 RepID=UPI002FEFA9F8
MRNIPLAVTAAVSLITGLGIGVASSSYAETEQPRSPRIKTIAVKSETSETGSASASCPSDYVLTGGGALTGNPLTVSAPSQDMTEWQIEDNGKGGDAVAWAICAKIDE